MTPKEKAKELFSKYLFYFPEFYHDEMSYDYNEDKAKQCALIAVDEIMQHTENSYHNEDLVKGARLYWQQVKQEIQNL